MCSVESRLTSIIQLKIGDLYVPVNSRLTRRVRWLLYTELPPPWRVGLWGIPGCPGANSKNWAALSCLSILSCCPWLGFPVWMQFMESQESPDGKKPPRGSHSIIIFCEETEPREVAGGPRLCPEPWLLDLCSLCYFTVYLTCNLIAVLIISGSVWMDFMAKDRIQKTHPILFLWQRTLTTTLCVDYIEVLAESRSLRISVWCVKFLPTCVTRCTFPLLFPSLTPRPHSIC